VISVETLLVAILGGLGGGLLGTWLQIRHERQEAFRDRMITAADDLSTGLLQAIIGLDDAYSACLEHAYLYPPDPNQLTFHNPSTGERCRPRARTRSSGLATSSTRLRLAALA
jgi:hypothetical protein